MGKLRYFMAGAAAFALGVVLSLGFVPTAADAPRPPEPPPEKQQPKAPQAKPAPPDLTGAAEGVAAATAAAHEDAKRLYALDVANGKAYGELRKQNPSLPEFQPLLPYVRYFWFPADPEWYDEDLIAYKGQFNFLSTQPEFVTPVLVAPNVFRIDTRDLGWGERQLLVLEKFAGLDVYFHAKKTFIKDEDVTEYWPGGFDEGEGKHYPRGGHPRLVKAGNSVFAPSPLLPQDLIDELRAWLYSEVPLLPADVFFYNTVRQQGLGNKELGVGYYEWFGKNGLKKLQDYFDVIGLDEKLSIKLYKDWRAVIISRTSGVSQNGRIIGSVNAVTGDVWFTEDVFDESAGAKGLVRDRIRRGELKFNAQEWFSRLANRLPMTFLNNADLIAQAKAPPEVGGDKSDLNVGNDPAIHDHISCMRCHGRQNMLMEFKDYIRDTFKPGSRFTLTDPNKNVELELRRQYLSDVYGRLEKAQKEYAEAVAEMTRSVRHPKGLTCTQFTKIYCEKWNRLIERHPKGGPPVTLDVAAREVGVAPKELVTLIEKHRKFRGQGDLMLLTFTTDPPGAMSREEWESRYQFAAGLVRGQAVPEKFNKEKK